MVLNRGGERCWVSLEVVYSVKGGVEHCLGMLPAANEVAVGRQVNVL